MGTLGLATTISDRDGHLRAKLEKLLPAVADRFSAIAVHATATTDEGVLAALEAAGASIATAPADRDSIGRHRREAISLLVNADVAGVLYADLDHLLRWIENNPAELDSVLGRMQSCDCLVIGRGPRSLAALPHRIALTEAIVNHMYALVTGRRWDVMMAARGLSVPAARAIVEGCDADTIGNDVAWPLFCEARGFKVEYVEAEGLTYRTNLDYARDLEDARDADPQAWATRVELAARHVEAMRPYIHKGQRDPQGWPG